MIAISVGEYDLDLYKSENITWSWTAFRFRDKLTDQYTNNFTIPKTDNNIKALDVYSTLDYPGVQFGEKITPATITVNGNAINIFIQVVQITPLEIEIAIFEDSFNSLEKNVTINDQLKDNHTTILEWNMWSMTNYPSKFVSYNYGMEYHWQLAQRHPYLRLKQDILDKIDLKGYNFRWDYVNNDWKVLCSKKVVCPENTIQVLEYTNIDGKTEEGGLLTVKGGQHICNDLSFSDTQTITYNRDCYVQMKIWYGWSKSFLGTQPFDISIQKNGSTVHLIRPSQGGHDTPYSNGMGTDFFSISLKKNDRINFYCPQIASYDNSFSMVIKLTTSAYEITDDDYNTELQYKDRLPRITIQYTNPPYHYYVMDGTSYTTTWGTFQTERLSFAYFGQYCNIPKIQLGDLLYGLQWLIGGKLIEDRQSNELYFDPTEYTYLRVQRDQEKYLKEINSIIPASEKLGKKNYLKYTDNENPTPITTIDNTWLEEERTLHELKFHYFEDNKIKQYSVEVKENIDITSVESPYDIFDVKFTNIEHPVIFNYNNRVEPISIKPFELDNLWGSKEVELTFYGTPLNFREYDTLFIDGRTYYVISGEYDLKNNITKVHCILVPWDVPTIEITNIQKGNNDGDVVITINVNSILPITEVVITYMLGIDISTQKSVLLSPQTGIQIFTISGLKPGSWIFIPTIKNLQSNNTGIGRNYRVVWQLPYVNIIELKKLSTTRVSCTYEVLSSYPLVSVEDTFFETFNPGIKRHSGQTTPNSGIFTFEYGLSSGTWGCYIDATNQNGTTRSQTKQITL